MTEPVSAAEVKRLRDETGAGMMDCKRALAEAGGDLQKAKDLLRQWGLAGIEKRAARAATEGVVAAYLHQVDSEIPPKLGVLVELDCETDFVAKTPEFKQLARDIAMHVAAMEPQWVRRDDVPPQLIEREMSIIKGSGQLEGKPPHIQEQIVDGKLKAVLSGRGGVLLDQPFIRDDSGKRTVADLVNETAAAVKENIVVRRFVRFRIGEEG